MGNRDPLERSRDGDRYFFELALYHEDMHIEALLMTLQTLALPLPTAYASCPRADAAMPVDSSDVQLAGGPMMLGTPTDEAAGRFVVDNDEAPRPPLPA